MPHRAGSRERSRGAHDDPRLSSGLSSSTPRRGSCTCGKEARDSISSDFHHRYVRGNTARSRHLTFLVRWPSRQAMQHARQRIREITARERLLLPVEDIVQDLNRFLGGWAGYFRYGNSAQFFDKIQLYAVNRLAIFVANHHQRNRRFGWWAVARQSPNHLGLIDLNGIIVPPRAHRPRHRER